MPQATSDNAGKALVLEGNDGPMIGTQGRLNFLSFGLSVIKIVGSSSIAILCKAVLVFS